MRSFQLKIIYTFLLTRKMLKILGYCWVCCFCFTESKSVLHLCWYCHVVSAFWGEVQKMWNATKLCFQPDFFSVIVTETNIYTIKKIILKLLTWIPWIATNLECSLNVTLFWTDVLQTFRKVGKVYWSGRLVRSLYLTKRN